jgi:hypothetical protein
MSDGRKVMMLFELIEPTPTKAYPMQNENLRDRLSGEDQRKFKEALVELSAKVVESAVLLGKSKLQGMNREMAEIQLKLQAEALCRGPSGELKLDRAIDWINICIRNLNQVRSAVGAQHILVRTAL